MLLLGSVFAYGQKFELGFQAGTSVNRTCLVDVGADVAWTWGGESGLSCGAGLGLRYSRPVTDIKAQSAASGESARRDYLNELSIPVFGRFRYRFPGSVFLMADAGYRIPIYYIGDHVVGRRLSTAFSGLYVEPQVGFSLGPGSSLALGCSIQRTEIGVRTQETTDSSVVFNYRAETSGSPVLFLRFIRHF